LILGRSKPQRSRKFLGIPVRQNKTNLGAVTHQIGEAGRHVGKLAYGIRVARKKAAKISRVFS